MDGLLGDKNLSLLHKAMQHQLMKWRLKEPGHDTDLVSMFYTLRAPPK